MVSPRFAVLLLAASSVALAISGQAIAQVPSTPVGYTPGPGMPGTSKAISGLAPRLPIVPEKIPRTPEGGGAGETWQTGRAPGDNAPVASFVDSLRGNDAAFEVIVGQGRLLTMKTDIAGGQGTAVIAVGDPTVIEFQVLPNSRMIRVIGRRVGVTDLSITTADGQTYGFEVHVVYDLELLRAHLRQIFPDALLRIGQLREHLVVEGQARSSVQVTRIIQTIEVFLASVQVPHSVEGEQAAGGQGRNAPLDQPGRSPNGGASAPPAPNGSPSDQPRGGAPQGQPAPEAAPESNPNLNTRSSFAAPQIINLIQVPGSQQVMLQVRIAELDRTGIREIGADILAVDPSSGSILGTAIGGATVSAGAVLGLGGLGGAAEGKIGSNNTAFGIFPSGDFEILLRALRKNSLLSILAEPNLVAMSGHRASFLAGGQFPVPVPQQSGGGTGTITIEWKDFGVQLNFVPYILDDETIRLEVAPEVSSIDESLGIILEGLAVPGVNTRKVNTTVELRQGQTLALAGLLTVELDGQTSRIPGLGDLPYIGALFSNTNHRRQEKELLVLVTPYLVSPMEACDVPPLPNDQIQDPNDLEFYLLNRIEGRTGEGFRSTTVWDDPCGWVRHLELERRHVCGPVGFSD